MPTGWCVGGGGWAWEGVSSATSFSGAGPHPARCKPWHSAQSLAPEPDTSLGFLSGPGSLLKRHHRQEAESGMCHPRAAACDVVRLS